METFSPGMRRALRQAQLYGYLVERAGKLYHPGGNQPVCGMQIADALVRQGWVNRRADRYEITPDGARTAVAD
jgi:hypothetical protein